jgi:hypothetical protein
MNVAEFAQVALLSIQSEAEEEVMTVIYAEAGEEALVALVW